MQAMLSSRANLRFAGAGGARMAALAKGPFEDWIADSAVLGLWDVLQHYGYFRKKFHGMLRSIATLSPDAVLLVDYPGFNLRLARALRRRDYRGKIIYYISPQVWAWNRGRIPRMARLLDLMLCVFPFEKAMYEASGLKTEFAGHPLLEALLAEKQPVSRNPNLFALLPGSRRREVQRNLPVMLSTARILLARRPDTQFEIAVASAPHADLASAMARDLGVVIRVGGAHDLMQRARAGIVCSGTATLEAAFFEMPYCLIYKAAWLTFQVGVRIVDVRTLGIVNILNNYLQNPPPNPALPAAPATPVVREFIQHFAQPLPMAEEALRLLDDESARDAMLSSFAKILSGLQPEGASQRAARAALAEL